MSHLRPLILGLLVGACAADALRDLPMSVDSVSPKQVSARGGTQLTLKGDAFTPETTVTLGGTAVRPHFVSRSELTLIAPPLLAGPAPIVVTTAGDSAQLKEALEVLPLELKFVEAAPIPLEPGAQITGFAARDFDHDDDVDLFVCGPGAPCRLLINDGRGNFEGPTFGADAGKPMDAGAADAGRKDGGFVDAGRADAGLPPLSTFVGARLLASDDLDGDGDGDVLLGMPDSGVFSFPGLGHGDFGPGTRVLDSVTALTVADLDHDGTPDVISAGAMLRAGSFAWPLPWPVGAIAVADVDGDHAPDLVLATARADAPLRLFLNHAGAFTEVVNGLPALTGGPWAALAAGDVDGDGSIDLVAVGPGQDRLLINDGKGHFFDATASALPVDAAKGTSVVLVDLDRDRDLDLVIGNASATMRLYVNDGTGKFLDRTPALPFRSDSSTAVCAANLDGDGDLDLVIATGAVPRLSFSVESR